MSRFIRALGEEVEGPASSSVVKVDKVADPVIIDCLVEPPLVIETVASQACIVLFGSHVSQADILVQNVIRRVSIAHQLPLEPLAINPFFPDFTGFDIDVEILHHSVAPRVMPVNDIVSQIEGSRNAHRKSLICSLQLTPSASPSEVKNDVFVPRIVSQRVVPLPNFLPHCLVFVLIVLTEKVGSRSSHLVIDFRRDVAFASLKSRFKSW